MGCGVATRSRGARGRAPKWCGGCKKQNRRERGRQKTYTLSCQKCRKDFVSVGSPQRKLCGECLGSHRKAEKARCQHCGCDFDRWKQGGNSTGVYCSKECWVELKRLHRLREQAERLQNKFLKNYRFVVAEIARRRERELKACELRPCLRCQKMFRNGRDRLCSDECRRLSRKINRKAGKKNRAAHGHYERCRIRGLPFDYSVDRPFVFERDGWLCLLCGEQTKPGDPCRAPTIGHVVPLKNPLNKRHGHTKENTFTNCARCNGRQGNAVMIDGHQNHDDPRGSYLERIRSTGYPLK